MKRRAPAVPPDKLRPRTLPRLKEPDRTELWVRTTCSNETTNEESWSLTEQVESDKKFSEELAGRIPRPPKRRTKTEVKRVRSSGVKSVIQRRLHPAVRPDETRFLEGFEDDRDINVRVLNDGNSGSNVTSILIDSRSPSREKLFQTRSRSLSAGRPVKKTRGRSRSGYCPLVISTEKGSSDEINVSFVNVCHGEYPDGARAASERRARDSSFGTPPIEFRRREGEFEEESESSWRVGDDCRVYTDERANITVELVDRRPPVPTPRRNAPYSVTKTACEQPGTSSINSIPRRATLVLEVPLSQSETEKDELVRERSVPVMSEKSWGSERGSHQLNTSLNRSFDSRPGTPNSASSLTSGSGGGGAYSAWYSEWYHAHGESFDDGGAYGRSRPTLKGIDSHIAEIRGEANVDLNLC